MDKKYQYVLGGMVAGLVLMYLIAPALGLKKDDGVAAKEQANKELVMKFEDLTFAKRDVSSAVLLLSDNFKQHNPTIPEGKEGFVNGVGGYLLKNNPNLKVENKKFVAEGDIVVVYSFGKFDSTNPKELGVAITDIFRIENGKIAEHWDVIQAVPAKSANLNTMF